MSSSKSARDRLSRLPVVLNTMTKSNLERKGFTSPSGHTPSLRKVRGGNSRPEPNLETGTEDSGGTLLTGLLIMGRSACFLLQPGTPVPKWHHPQWAGTSHINHESRKSPTDLPMDNLVGGWRFSPLRLPPPR